MRHAPLEHLGRNRNSRIHFKHNRELVGRQVPITNRVCATRVSCCTCIATLAHRLPRAPLVGSFVIACKYGFSSYLDR